MAFEWGKNGGAKKYLEKLENAAPKLMRKFMLDVYGRLITITPVDTGRARFGWYCTINGIDYGIPPAAPYGYAPTDAAGKHAEVFYHPAPARAQNTFTTTVKVSDILYISNSVPYVKYLNEGRSRQAPARFKELAFEDAVKNLERYVKGKGLFPN